MTGSLLLAVAGAYLVLLVILGPSLPVAIAFAAGVLGITIHHMQAHRDR